MSNLAVLVVSNYLEIAKLETNTLTQALRTLLPWLPGYYTDIQEFFGV